MDSSPTTTKPTIARIAVFTVRSFAIEHMLSVINERKDAEIACVLTCPGPQNRRSNAHTEVVNALYKHGYHNVDVIVSNKKSKWADLIAQYDANCVFCSGFPWLIPTSVLDDPRITLGVINFHNSLLPKLMGPNAFGWQIVLGQNEIGYCVHRMSAEFDTGPILFTETVPLDVNEDYQDLQKKMPEVYVGMVHKAITMALEQHPGYPQVGTPSAAPKFTPEFRYIDFNATALEAHNKVRAYFGVRDHPLGALATIDGELLCIKKTRYNAPVKVVGAPLLLESENHFHHSDDDRTSGTITHNGMDIDILSLTTTSTETTHLGGGDHPLESSTILPGTVLSRGGGTILVQCGDTSLEILQWDKVTE